jgi:multicomponent K+:H+ antiporter subunit F
MIAAALYFGFGAISLSLLLCLYRVMVGPDLPDRIVALDTLYINGIALLVLVGIRFNDAVYFESALLIAMMGFVSTVAWCKHVIRGTIID